MTESFGCKNPHIAGYDRGREHAETEIKRLTAENEVLKQKLAECQQLVQKRGS